MDTSEKPVIGNERVSEILRLLWAYLGPAGTELALIFLVRWLVPKGNPNSASAGFEFSPGMDSEPDDDTPPATNTPLFAPSPAHASPFDVMLDADEAALFGLWRATNPKIRKRLDAILASERLQKIAPLTRRKIIGFAMAYKKRQRQIAGGQGIG
jgi:hypothetical protein